MILLTLAIALDSIWDTALKKNVAVDHHSKKHYLTDNI